MYAGFGLASQLGVLSDLPSVGIGKNVIFRYSQVLNTLSYIKDMTICLMLSWCILRFGGTYNMYAQ